MTALRTTVTTAGSEFPPAGGSYLDACIPFVAAQDPPTLRLADIARLLNVSNERARQITNGADFPRPVITGPRRAWSREEVQWWMDDVRWWESKPWRKLVE